MNILREYILALARSRGVSAAESAGNHSFIEGTPLTPERWDSAIPFPKIECLLLQKRTKVDSDAPRCKDQRLIMQANPLGSRPIKFFPPTRDSRVKKPVMKNSRESE